MELTSFKPKLLLWKHALVQSYLLYQHVLRFKFSVLNYFEGGSRPATRSAGAVCAIPYFAKAATNGMCEGSTCGVDKQRKISLKFVVVHQCKSRWPKLHSLFE